MNVRLPAPGHAAVVLLSELVAELDKSPIARQYLKGVPRLVKLERDAREIAAQLDSPASRAVVIGSDADQKFCGVCRGFHRQVDP